MSDVTIEPATVSTRAAACEMLGTMAVESSARNSGDYLLLVARDSTEVVAAVSGRLTSGGWGVLRLPEMAFVTRPSTLNSLLGPVHEWFRNRHTPFVQTLDDGHAWTRTLERFGYRFVTEILDLETLRGPLDEVAFNRRLQFETVTPTVNGRLTDLLTRTYAGSAEFVGFPESRNSVANLQDHLTSSGDDATWCVLRYEGRDIGLLLMGRAINEEAELLYLGIVPEFRRQGFGLMAIAHAFQKMQRQGIRVVRTSVDIVNEPAIHCYVAAGFQQTARRKMLVYCF